VKIELLDIYKQLGNTRPDKELTTIKNEFALKYPIHDKYQVYKNIIYNIVNISIDKTHNRKTYYIYKFFDKKNMFVCYSYKKIKTQKEISKMLEDYCCDEFNIDVKYELLQKCDLYLDIEALILCDKILINEKERRFNLYDNKLSINTINDIKLKINCRIQSEIIKYNKHKFDKQHDDNEYCYLITLNDKKYYVGKNRGSLVGKLLSLYNDADDIKMKFLSNEIKKYIFRKVNVKILKVFTDNIKININDQIQKYINHYKSSDKEHGFNIETKEKKRVIIIK
jgi:hypothetical protein